MYEKSGYEYSMAAAGGDVRLANETYARKKLLSLVVQESSASTALTLSAEAVKGYKDYLTYALDRKGHRFAVNGNLAFFKPSRTDCRERPDDIEQIKDLICGRQAGKISHGLEGVVFRPHLSTLNGNALNREQPVRVAYYCRSDEGQSSLSVSFSLPNSLAFSLFGLLSADNLFARVLAERIVLHYGLPESIWFNGYGDGDPLKPPYECLGTMPEIITSDRPYQQPEDARRH